MTDPLASARNYLGKVTPAAEGSRNDSLNRLAYAILERFELQQADFEDLLSEWAASCSPAIPSAEAEKTIRSAWAGAHSKGIVGTKARQTSRARAIRNLSSRGKRQ